MFQSESFWQMLVKGGPTMLVLALGSFLSWMIILERWWNFRKAEKGGEQLSQRVSKLVRAGKVSEAVSLAQVETGSVGRLLHAGLLHGGRDRASLVEAMDRKAVEETLNLESRLTLLASLGTTAPYVGLFGTVLGIINAFQALAAANQAGAAVVSAGIAEALVCTAAGLAVAVPAVLAFNAYTRKVSRLETRMGLAASELSEAFFDFRPQSGGRP